MLIGLTRHHWTQDFNEAHWDCLAVKKLKLQGIIKQNELIICGSLMSSVAYKRFQKRSNEIIKAPSTREVSQHRLISKVSKKFSLGKQDFVSFWQTFFGKESSLKILKNFTEFSEERSIKEYWVKHFCLSSAFGNRGCPLSRSTWKIHCRSFVGN